MTRFLTHRLRHEHGFTLIELLVVILIIGVLAGVAIPMFLSQTAKAHDSNVQAAIATAQLAEKTFLTANGHYTPASGTQGNPLLTIEPTLTGAFAATSSSPSGFGMTVTGASASGFTVSATDPVDNISYSLRDTNGVVSRSCSFTGGGSAANQGACDAQGSWGG
ncbi:MAG TPA: type II secretion system protein [Solirubrobacteraceae bacterium]|nr:type II secretion system protein [Solirubrobacteraceae bacterium]